MVIGPDGKPCKICTSFRNWKPAAAASAARKAHTSTDPSTSTALPAAALLGTSQTAPVDTRSPNCPPDVEQIGRATWTFLHTTAAYYPERPSPVQRANMLNLLHALPVLYPCSWCAMHLGGEMKLHPPDVSGRLGLSKWLCERHNEVNERLGKEQFDCSTSSTDERWKDGPKDGSCE